ADHTGTLPFQKGPVGQLLEVVTREYPTQRQGAMLIGEQANLMRALAQFRAVDYIVPDHGPDIFSPRLWRG
ncbi:MAG: hypothetical protein WA889_05180, partial [Xanthobacteraceae bacterium]